MERTHALTHLWVTELIEHPGSEGDGKMVAWPKIIRAF